MLASYFVVFDLDNLTHDVMTFLTERHLATFTTTRTDGSPQVTPVGVTYEPETKTARIITWATSYKALTIAADPNQQVATCQVDGGRWLTIYGTATVTSEASAVAEAVRRYTERYRPPKQRDDRVVIEIAVDRMIGRA
jgi:PPOX class probable F420-dependent enzyme